MRRLSYREGEAKKKGEKLNFSPFGNAMGTTYPIGVLLAPAPEPEVSTRITPD